MTPRKALVTGASDGIGRALALALAQEGYHITAVARDEARLAQLWATLGGAPHRVLAADLATEAGVERVCAISGSTPMISWSTTPVWGCMAHSTSCRWRACSPSCA